MRSLLQMVHKESTVPYGEVEGFSTLLGYKTSNAGCCKVGGMPTAQFTLQRNAFGMPASQ